MSVPTDWFEDFFHGVTLDLWRKAISPEQTKAEGEFISKTLQCAAGAHVLDVPCGNGRLSFQLAKHGLKVTGLDISEEFIEEARASSDNFAIKKKQASAGVTELFAPKFILGDKRAIKGSRLYDGAYCFGNSFGFLKYEDMEQFLNGLGHALKPGARFIMETGMAAESFLPDFEEQTCHQIGDISVTTKERYNAVEGCVDSEYIMERDGQAESRFAKHWVYTTAEIQRMLRRAGFGILDVYGSLKYDPYKLGCRELFVVAESRARTGSSASRRSSTKRL